MAPAIKQKVHNLPGVEYLYEVMPPDQLEIPAYITEYDMTVRRGNRVLHSQVKLTRDRAHLPTLGEPRH